MTQTINLSKHLDHHVEIPVSARQVYIAAAVTLVLSLLMCIVVAVQNTSKSNDILIAKNKQNSLLNSSTDGNGNTHQKTLQEVDLLRAQVQGKQRILQSLKLSKGERQNIFSERLAGLGRQNVRGLWLNHIAFSSGDNTLSLAGNTRDASLLPRYLQALSKEQIFSGLRFDLMKIYADKDEKEELGFIVAVLPDDIEDDPS